MEKFSRGMSMPPNGWPQIQLEEMELYLAQEARKAFPLDPLLAEAMRTSLAEVRGNVAASEFSPEHRKELRQEIYQLLYGTRSADTVNKPHNPNSLGTDNGEGSEGREVGQEPDEAYEKDG